MSKYVDNKKQPSLFYLEWWDHCGTADSGWEHINKSIERTAETVHTVGWVMSETDREIVVVSHLTEDGYAQGIMTLLKVCIHKAVKLKDPRKWEISRNAVHRSGS